MSYAGAASLVLNTAAVKPRLCQEAQKRYAQIEPLPLPIIELVNVIESILSVIDLVKIPVNTYKGCDLN